MLKILLYFTNTFLTIKIGFLVMKMHYRITQSRLSFCFNCISILCNVCRWKRFRNISILEFIALTLWRTMTVEEEEGDVQEEILCTFLFKYKIINVWILLKAQQNCKAVEVIYRKVVKLTLSGHQFICLYSRDYQYYIIHKYLN